jgi:hypothetical protein
MFQQHGQLVNAHNWSTAEPHSAKEVRCEKTSTSDVLSSEPRAVIARQCKFLSKKILCF